MPEDTVIVGSIQQNQISSDRGFGTYLLIILVVFAILWVLYSHYFSGAAQAGKEAENADLESSQEQSNGVPEISAERISDVLIYNEAIDKKDKKLCERIAEESLKGDCFKFFTVNGL